MFSSSSTKKIFFVFLFVLFELSTQITFAQIDAPIEFSSLSQVVSSIENSIEKIDFFDKRVESSVKQSLNSKPGSRFTEEEINSLLTTMINGNTSIPKDIRIAFGEMSSYIAKRLCEYKVTGVAFAFDPNFGFLYDNQNPSFTVVYKNNEGGLKTRIYDSSINSLGTKVALSLNFNFICLTGDLDFENTNKVLQLGTGIDVDLLIPAKILATMRERFIPSGVFLTYAPILNAPGNFFMLGLDFGLACGINIVTSGTLTPRN